MNKKISSYIVVVIISLKMISPYLFSNAEPLRLVLAIIALIVIIYSKQIDDFLDKNH